MAIVLSKRITNAALPICMAGMDGCWIYIVAWLVATRVFQKVAVLPLPPPLLLALIELLGLWVVSRLFDRTRLPDVGIQVLSGAAGLAVSALVVLLYTPPGPDGFTLTWAGGAAVSVVVCLVL